MPTLVSKNIDTKPEKNIEQYYNCQNFNAATANRRFFIFTLLIRQGGRL